MGKRFYCCLPYRRFFFGFFFTRRLSSGLYEGSGDIASKLNNPNASRAVGTAIGDNTVAFLIPCHRVIRSSGELGGYHWGLTRKAAIIGWEAARNGFSVSE